MRARHRIHHSGDAGAPTTRDTARNMWQGDVAHTRSDRQGASLVNLNDGKRDRRLLRRALSTPSREWRVQLPASGAPSVVGDVHSLGCRVTDYAGPLTAGDTLHEIDVLFGNCKIGRVSEARVAWRRHRELGIAFEQNPDVAPVDSP